MTFRIYSCRVITPLYKIPKTLKLNDIYRFELVKFMYKLHHGALPKIYDKFFQSISCVHSYQTRFANNQNYLIRRVYKNSEKKTMFQRDCTLDRNRTEPCPMTSSAYSIEIVSSRIMNKFVFIFNMFGYMPFCGYCICLLQEREAFFFLFFLSILCFVDRLSASWRLSCVCAWWGCVRFDNVLGSPDWIRLRFLRRPGC